MPFTFQSKNSKHCFEENWKSYEFQFNSRAQIFKKNPTISLLNRK